MEKAFDRVPREVIKWAMRKLGVDERLIRAAMAMYRKSKGVIRINSTVKDRFGVKVRVNQGSILSYLLFIIVPEVLSRECISSISWEMLYANDLVIIADNLEELGASNAAWKNCMESKRLMVNLATTKVMISDVDQGPAFTSGKHSCGVWVLVLTLIL